MTLPCRTDRLIRSTFPGALIILDSGVPGALWGPNPEANIPATLGLVSALPVSRRRTNFQILVNSN